MAMLQDPQVMAKLSKMMSGGMPNPAELAADPKLRKRTIITSLSLSFAHTTPVFEKISGVAGKP